MSLPSDPAARKAIKKCMDELSASMTRIESERDLIKEAINNCCEEYEMNKKWIGIYIISRNQYDN